MGERVRAIAPQSCGRDAIELAKTTQGHLCELRFSPDLVPGQICSAEVWGYAAQAVDVFAVGVCLFMLSWQCPPWQTATLSDPMFAFVHSRGERGPQALLQHWKKPMLAPEAMQLLTEMLRADPAKRPSAAACLASPWLAAAGVPRQAESGQMVDHASALPQQTAAGAG